MGLLTDVFIASREDMMAADLANNSPSELFPTLSAKRVDPMKFMLLDAIVAGEDAAAIETDPAAFAARLDERFRCVRDLGEEMDTDAWAWVYELPIGLAKALGRLTSAEIGSVGTRWARTQEWRADGVATAQAIASIIQYLNNLCQLAARAQREGKCMFLWMCA